MKKLVIALLALLTAGTLHAQTSDNAEWWSYVAAHDGKPGTTRLDMGLRRVAPVSGYPYVIVTGVGYRSSRPDGLPEPGDTGRLDAISEAVATAIGRKTRSIYAGTVIHNLEQLNYIYVIDPNGLGETVAAVYAKLCPGCEIHTEIKADAAWSTYRDFLYPDEETRRRYGLLSY
ncbi:DUF695 domain-containing protein [Herbaspirillum chlorophenolicum]|uniref:DUF695 domain-containing protein n=1 Tax=Herbaspirillum chlorophenolicum TaxID=211589 RepID=UPI00067DE991|nr:DUF695 domain-containing protein [Herbaspirillum chlorophenolicum]